MPVSTPSTRLPPAGKYTKKLKNLAAEARKRAHDEKVAEKNRAAEEAKAKAEQEKLFQEAQARRAAVAKADRAHLQALHARQEDKALGPIKAKKNSHALSRSVWKSSSELG